MDINWNLLSDRLAERYRDHLNIENKFSRYLILNEKNLNWIDFKDSNTESFRVFSKEVNRLELSINLFENLLLFEDLRYEIHGIEDFPIDMPREYFRFPAKNDPRGLAAQKFNSDELDKIEGIILESRDSLRIRNDENIARELMHRLEFLSLFSYFEAFLERVLGTDIWGCSEDNTKKANHKVMRMPLPDAFKFVLKELKNPEPLRLVTALNGSIFNILHFAYLVRNAHTHNLGKATNYVIEKGLAYGSLIKQPIQDAKGNIIRTEIVPSIEDIGMRSIVLGQYISLSVLTSLFRSYLFELAYILDASIENV